MSSALRTVVMGLLINGALALVKLTAGIVGHSYALIADAIESLSDVVASVVTYQGVRVAQQPPDEHHPYGHGKAEAIAALIVSILLLLAGVAVVVGAVRKIASPHEPPEVFVLWVLGVVIVVKEFFFRLARRVARKTSSVALVADAWHHRSDALTSLAAGIGIALSIYGGPGLAAAEAWASLVAAAVIFLNGWLLMREPLAELLDAHPAELVEQVRVVARAVQGVRQVEKVLARKVGRQYLVDMHLHVDPLLTVRDAHALGGLVKATIRKEVPAVADVLMHVEPAEV